MGDEPIQAGQVLAERYRLETKLGEGGFGAVWRAQHVTLEAPIAIKLLDPEIAQDEVAKERFLREAKALANLRSPHVVQIIDYGLEDQQPFIAMELLEGESLAQRIKRAAPLPATEALWIVTHVARAIGRAHESGIVHRDLKPENVFIVQNDDEEVAKVLDFGVAKIDEGKLGTSGSATRTGSLLGTPYYMSPEQALGNKEVDYRSDLWSIGVIAFEMLTGKRPFYSDGLGDLVVQITVRPLPVPSLFAPVPRGFDGWFAETMARDPAQRPASAREVVETLRLALEAEDTLVTIPGPDDSLRAPAFDQRRDDIPFGATQLADSRAVPTRAAPAHGPMASATHGLARPAVKTLEQPATFNATTRAEPVERPLAPTRRRSHRLLSLVALGALVLGVGGGVAVMRLDATTDNEPPDGLPSGARPRPRFERIEGPREITHAKPPPQPKHPAQKTAASASAGSEEKVRGEDGPPQEWLPREGPDGGIIKPEWARPDQSSMPPDPELGAAPAAPASVDRNPYETEEPSAEDDEPSDSQPL